MTKDQSKIAVLKILREQDAPVSLPELLEALEKKYSDRTVRRWLAEWVSNGIVLKKGKKRGTRYVAIKEKLTKPADIYFSQTSQQVINQIKIPYDLRKPVTYQSKWLNEYRPNVGSYLVPAQLIELDEVGNRARKSLYTTKI